MLVPIHEQMSMEACGLLKNEMTQHLLCSYRYLHRFLAYIGQTF